MALRAVSGALACLLSSLFIVLAVVVVSVVVVAVVLAAAAATAAAAAAAATSAVAIFAAAVVVVVVVVLVFSLFSVLPLRSLSLSIFVRLLLLLVVPLLPLLSCLRLLFDGFVLITAARSKGSTAADLDFDIAAFAFCVFVKVLRFSSWWWRLPLCTCCHAYYSGRYRLCCCRRCGCWFCVAIITGARVIAAVFAVIIVVAFAIMVVLIFG